MKDKLDKGISTEDDENFSANIDIYKCNESETSAGEPSTSHSCNSISDSIRWNCLTVDNFMASIINQKLNSIKNECDNYYHYEKNKNYFRDENDTPNKKPKYSKEEESSFRSKYSAHHPHSIRKYKTIVYSDGQNARVNLEMTDRKKRNRRRGRRKRVAPDIRIEEATPRHSNALVNAESDEEFARKARWAVAITAGLLILTCMFLVGITLRMAPVIDQMVKTQNEELMNSLQRTENSTGRTLDFDDAT